MKVILSTYNFYPVHRGGTEVYTRLLARHLKDAGHQVLIIAAWDAEQDRLGSVVLDNGSMHAVRYGHEDLDVVGIALKNVTAADQYKGHRDDWTSAYQQLLKDLGWDDADRLIMNGLTIVSGSSLADALIASNPGATVNIIVHTPFHCLKADMLFSGTGTRCTQRITARTCSTCYLSARTGLPHGIAGGLSNLMRWTGVKNITGMLPAHLEAYTADKISDLAHLNDIAQRWIVLSEDMRGFLAGQEFLTPAKLSVIRHGIDVDLFGGPFPERPSAPITFTYAGRFDTVKGVSLLAEAWSSLPDEPKVRMLRLAGNWRSTATGTKVHERLKDRKDVEFLENLGQQDVADLYRKSHCLIVPSLWVETGPMVIHEAILCGCDVLASDIGGQGELARIYAERAATFRSGSADSLRTAINNYIPVNGRTPKAVNSSRMHFQTLFVQIDIPG